MTVSMYDFSIPVLTRGLTNMSAFLDKAAVHAAAKKFDPVVLAQARLFPDMHPLVRQVQIACDTAKLGVIRGENRIESTLLSYRLSFRK